MTITTIRDKYQEILNADSAYIHNSPFRVQIIRSQEERYIKYSAMSGAMYAFRYSQKWRVQKWLESQLAQYQNDAQNHADAGVRQLSQWSAETVAEMLDDLK